MSKKGKEAFYEVEKIVTEKYENGKWLIQVKWKGYSRLDWVEADNVMYDHDLQKHQEAKQRIQSYYQKQNHQIQAVAFMGSSNPEGDIRVRTKKTKSLNEPIIQKAQRDPDTLSAVDIINIVRMLPQVEEDVVFVVETRKGLRILRREDLRVLCPKKLFRFYMDFIQQHHLESDDDSDVSIVVQNTKKR